MFDDPLITWPLALVWAPAIVVGSFWARRSFAYGLVTILVAVPCLLPIALMAGVAMGALMWIAEVLIFRGRPG